MLCNTRNTLKSQNMSKSEECNNLFKLFAVEGWRWHICIFIWVLCVNNGTCQYVNCQSRTYQPAEGNPVTVDDCKATPVISQPTQIYVGIIRFVNCWKNTVSHWERTQIDNINSSVIISFTTFWYDKSQVVLLVKTSNAKTIAVS